MTVKVSQVAGSATIGICYCHRFPIFVPGALISSMAIGQAYAENMPIGTQSSIALAACGHVGVVITGSSTLKHNGIGVARQFDTGVGCYNFTILTGAFNTNTSFV